MMNTSDNPSAGFTIVELLVVMAVIAIIASAAIPAYLGMSEGAKITSATEELNAMTKAIYTYSANMGHFPDSLAVIGYGHKVDPWGTPYVYNRLYIEGEPLPEVPLQRVREDGEKLNRDFDLYSLGPDHMSDPSIDDDASADDVVRAENGNYLGPVRVLRLQ